MRAERRRQLWRRAGITFGAIVIIAGGAIAFLNPRLTRYVESDAFRADLEKQTAKGLHLRLLQLRVSTLPMHLARATPAT